MLTSMDILDHSRVARLRRQGHSFRESAELAGATLADVRRALREDDDVDEDRRRTLAELRAEVRADGGFDSWWWQMTGPSGRLPPERDPGARSRLDGQAMRERDEQVAKLYRAGVPFRAIAARLDMSLGSVQKAVQRIQAGRSPR